MWLIITTISYFLNAISMAINKILLDKSIPKPLAYTFYVGVLGSLFIPFFLPFGFSLLPAAQIIISILAGWTFVLALWAMFSALRQEEATRITTYIGSLTPIFIFFLAMFLLQEALLGNEIIAFIMIIVGSIMISYQKAIPYRLLGIATGSAILFAISHTLTKYIYEQTDFINGFIWTRLGSVIGVLVFLFFATARRAIFASNQAKPKSKVLFLFGQAAGGISFVLLNYAFSLHSVTIVQALQGIQYAFLFILVLIFSKKFPHILEEKLTPMVLAQKIVAIGVIIGGLFLLGR